MENIKRITTAFCDRAGASSPEGIHAALTAIENLFRECNEELEAAGMPACDYDFQEEAIAEMTENMHILQTYARYAHTYVWQTLDFPLFTDFKNHATQSLSLIVLDDLATDNSFRMEEHRELYAQGNHVVTTEVKKELKFSDFLGTTDIRPEDGVPVLENVETIGEFASLFRKDYDKMKMKEGDINKCIKGYLTSGEYGHKAYHPAQDFLSGLLDITIIKPIIECITGKDLITGERLSDFEMTMKAAGAVVDLFTLGQAMVLTKGAGLGAKALGKTVALELASNAAAYSTGYACNAFEVPGVVTWALSVATGCMVSSVGGKYLFKNADGKIIKECTADEAERFLKELEIKPGEMTGIDDIVAGVSATSNVPITDLVSAKEAEIYVRYVKNGSMEGLTSEGIESIKKIEDLLKRKKIDYQDVLYISDWENVVKGGLDANLLNNMGKFTDDTLENNYQAYVNRKIKKGQTPKDRLEWKEVSDYWTKESPVARGNNFNKTVREAGIYDYHEVYLENGKRLDSYDPDAGEIISRKATDLDKITEGTYREYLSEFSQKYSEGTKIRSNAYPELDGQGLKGQYILEIPASNANISNIDYYKQIAAEYDVILRFTEEVQ